MVYGAVALKSCVRPVARARTGLPNRWFSALAPGRTAVFDPGRLAELLFLPEAHIRHAYESRLSRGLGLLPDALAELLFLTQDALANSCFCTWAAHGHPNSGFSALAPGGLAELLFQPKAHIRHAYESRLSRGLGLLADALAELLFLTQDALANSCFCTWAGHGHPNRGFSALAQGGLAELLFFARGAHPSRVRKPAFPGTWAAPGRLGRTAVFGPGRLGEPLFLPLAQHPSGVRKPAFPGTWAAHGRLGRTAALDPGRPARTAVL